MLDCETDELQLVVETACRCSRLVSLELVGGDDALGSCITADERVLCDHLLQLPRLILLRVSGIDLV